MSYKKPFNQNLYDLYDEPAKTAVSNFLGSKGFYISFPETKKSSDITALKPQEHEVQVCMSWTKDEFPFKSFQVYARKKHLFQTDRPMWLWILNTSATMAYVIPKEKFTEDRIETVYSSYLSEKRKKDTYEDRYIIPLEDGQLVQLKEENK